VSTCRTPDISDRSTAPSNGRPLVTAAATEEKTEVDEECRRFPSIEDVYDYRGQRVVVNHQRGLTVGQSSGMHCTSMSNNRLHRSQLNGKSSCLTSKNS